MPQSKFELRTYELQDTIVKTLPKLLRADALLGGGRDGGQDHEYGRLKYLLGYTLLVLGRLVEHKHDTQNTKQQ